MIDSNQVIGYSGIERRVQRATMGEPGRPSRRREDIARRRHAAIAAKVPNWHTYRHWAHKTRGSWEQET